MSNSDCAQLYERIIDDVIQESRQDFEDAGIDEQTLLDLRSVWREKLSKTNVASFSWDTQADVDSRAGQEEEEPFDAGFDFNGAGDAGLHLPQNDLVLPQADTQLEGSQLTGSQLGLGSGIILPGGQLEQSDGPGVGTGAGASDAGGQTIEFELEMGKDQIKRLKKQNLRRVVQADGADSELGSDLDDSDEINSDLDDPDDDDINSDDDDDDPDANIMLCLYDRVQRVRNRWKCNLKDGIANIDGKDYAFQKATGDSEW